MDGDIVIGGTPIIPGVILKRAVAVICSLLMMFYFVLLGLPRRAIHAA
jgi:hypothetical protein